MKFTVKTSKISGQGCFATRNIKKGEKITELMGERVSRNEIHRRIEEGIENIDDPLQIGDELFIDLDEPSRFFNHSCNPNAGIRGENELFALKDIPKNEEITFDYSTTVSKNINNGAWTMDCKCNAKNCRKKIGNILTIPKEKLRQYAKVGALPDFIKDQIKDLLWKNRF